jgi:SagB-type dehydrogenase family enzyme
MDELDRERYFLKASVYTELENIETDQEKKLPQPPLEKEYPPEAELVNLTAPENFNIEGPSLLSLLRTRETRRIYSDAPLTLMELSFLLWAAQGVKRIIRDGYAALRPVPSAGARHALETYIFVHNVEGLKAGLYRYLPIEHKLLPLPEIQDMGQKLSEACSGQSFAAKSAVTFVWSAIPYRMEWRYSKAAHKFIALDAGHVCQNLYLACEAIGAGTCAIAAYDQDKMDSLLGLDGKDEFAIYIAPVGKQK